MKGMIAPQIPSRTSRKPLAAPRLRRICSMPAIAYHFLSEYLYVPSVGLTVRHYPERQIVFLGRGSTFYLVLIRHGGRPGHSRAVIRTPKSGHPDYRLPNSGSGGGIGDPPGAAHGG